MKINRISEATGSGNAGTFKVPIVLAPQDWKDEQLAPFNNPVYHYTNAELAYEESDGDFKETPEQRKKIENKTELLSRIDTYLKNFYTGQNDEDGGNIGDVKNPEKIIQRAIGTLKEDLAVWFGTKKKPKGSNQPKGPWVNICRKVDGKHPPCGRQDTSKGSYPKCRAAGVAGKMSDSQKRSACQQKRTAEKKDTQTGKGQKPVMTSYKPKNESMKKTIRLTENDLIRIIKKVITEQTGLEGKVINLFCQSKNNSFRESGLTLHSEEDMYGGLNGGGFKRIFLTPSPIIPRESYEPSTVTLDVIPAAKMDKDFLEKSKMAKPNQKIYLISPRTNVNHFCSIDNGTDREWSNYLNTL